VAQSSKMSLVEVTLGTMVKFLWACFLWHFVIGPIFDLPTNVGDSFLITFIFMANGMVIAL